MSKSTIVDVARLAGVSVASVSRVLNQNYPVSAATREKVLRCIDELHYEVNRNARNLKTNKSHMIGVVVTDISNAYFMAIAKGLETVMDPAGYTLVCASTHENPRKEQQIIRSLQEYQVDGIVLASCCTQSDLLRSVIHAPMACVLVDNPLPDMQVDMVEENDREAMETLITHLIEMGHSRIALLNGDLRLHTGMSRFQGYLDALEKAGIELDAHYVLDAHFDKAEATEKCRMLLSQRDAPPPTVVVGASNLMTEGALVAFGQLGLRVPEDISVASFNELNSADLIRPVMTHLQDNTFDIGRIAGNLLLARMEGGEDKAGREPVHMHRLTKRLVIGDSVQRIAGRPAGMQREE